MNLQLGGTRNFSYQYKGIRTASGGSINVVANHATWLYYALGSCSQINATFTGSGSTDPATNYSAHANNVHYLDIGETATAKTFSDTLEGHTSTGPIFYRTATDSSFMIPPVAHQDTATHFALLTLVATFIGWLFPDMVLAHEFKIKNKIIKFRNVFTMISYIKF